jgi:hypothetical protein
MRVNRGKSRSTGKTGMRRLTVLVSLDRTEHAPEITERSGKIPRTVTSGPVGREEGEDGGTGPGLKWQGAGPG